MSFVFQCPRCHSKLKSKKDLGDRQINCPKCQQQFLGGSHRLVPVAAPTFSGPDESAIDSIPSAPNPYLSPAAHPPTQQKFHIPDHDLGKIEIIIQDARGVVIAILICFFIVVIGSFIVGPWYYFRLKAWREYSKKYPFLLDENAIYGSFGWRFQTAHNRLLAGFGVGMALLVIYGTMLSILLVAAILGVL